MTTPENQLSKDTTGENGSTRAINGNNATSINNKNTLASSSPQDPFLFYSNPANLRRELSLQPIDYDAEMPSSNSEQTVRKTRISFEKDPLTLLMEDADFLPQLEVLNELGISEAMSFEYQPDFVLEALLDSVGDIDVTDDLLDLSVASQKCVEKQ
ncbi:hypothetical protein ACHAXR_006744 [Thalassiosira sp. AJA248-18]